jgi:hypothetical protein
MAGIKMENEFKKELKALLEKYNAAINFNVGGDSDTYGLYDEEMAVYFFDTKKSFKLSNGWGISKTDL